MEITLIGIMAGAFGGATIATKRAMELHRITVLEPYSDVLSLSLVVLGIADLSVILGEIVPKQLALKNPERMTVAMAPLMHLLSRLASPTGWVLSPSTHAFLRLLRMRPALPNLRRRRQRFVPRSKQPSSGLYRKLGP
jgi:putative hemolysin